MEERLLYKINVTGQVQGVGFRWNAAIEARSRGITGYVRNLPNGNVYIEAEGSREQLNSYVEWCKLGPGIGFVESVDVDTFPPVNYTDFLIDH
jgi:acylphosphatase